MWPGGGSISYNAGPNEQEILLPANTKMLVQKVRDVSKEGPTADGFGATGQKFVVEVLILPSP
jgi:hypothetical protein